MKTTINVATCNFEANGKGDRQLWQKMHDHLAALSLDLLLRQETWDALDHGGELHEAAKTALAMDGWIGQRCCTGVYANPLTFDPLRGWSHDVGPMWALPPTVQAFRLRAAGPQSLPLIAASYHLAYNNADQRLLEARDATRWPDKWWPLEDRRSVQLPVLIGGDHNSDPQAGAPGEPAQRDLSTILDRVHLAHRTYLAPDGTLVLDDRPDRVLRIALDDIARHLAERPGHGRKLTPTVHGSDTQGAGSRIDRIYASPLLLPALVDVEVIDATGLSDHHIVLGRFDAEALAEILRHPQPQPADRISPATAP
ncbi:endonuclease/exonuclease/phosphatase family protein [Streptacidiphilus sp. EB103A]|uniref:endonuclease/exonuclease/phosphatase family protein n=1 Tax=Streptacidiphilus sp. EB103A TaxID=3156275 RepID=UPI003513E682